MSSDEQQLKDFLERIQLLQFYGGIVDVLHVTRVEHFEHVIEADLQNLGMSMPEIRRLFDNIKKNKRNFFTKLKKSFRISNTNNDTDFPSNNPTIISTIPSVKSPKQELKCLIQEKDIAFMEVIGRGAFGSVRSAEWTTQNNEKIFVAVKCIRRTTGNGIEDVQNEVVKEASAMSCLNHPNLIRLFGVLISSPMMLVTELAPLGTLLKKLRQESSKFPVAALCSFLVQIAAGMKYLEQNKIVHRDLAARNILLMTYEKIKIGDFGLARPLDEADHYVMHPDGLIPFAWCAPECLKFKRFSHASDVWAFGITSCELFTYGAEPWAGLNGAQILEKIEEPYNDRPPCPDFCPREIYSILCGSCWKYEEEERAEFQALEKMLLSVLPTEVKAMNCSNNTLNKDWLSFSPGDIVTVFNTNSFDGIWKGQNRRTGQVGFVPSYFVNISAGTIQSLAEKTPPTNDETGEETYDKLSSYNRLTVPSEGFTNKLWTSLWGSDCLETQPQQQHSSVSSKLHTKVQGVKEEFECTNSCGSGYGTSSMSSYCEDCLSQNSIDSGCLCRCSTYSSDSSQKCPNDVMSQQSQPIMIPGGGNEASGHRVAFNRRCSSCSSSNRHSVLSDTLDRDSPISASPSFRMEGLQNAVSAMKISNNPTRSVKQAMSTSEGAKTSASLKEHRRSLPDLANPRKKSLLRRSLRLRKRKEDSNNLKPKESNTSGRTGAKFYTPEQETIVSGPISPSKDAQTVALFSPLSSSIDAPSGTKFYVPGQDAMISGPLSSSTEGKFTCPLYDLVPIRNREEEQVSPPLSTSSPRENIDTNKEVVHPSIIHPSIIHLYKQTTELYENVDRLEMSPVAPPRRKKRQSKRFSMIELNLCDDDIQNGTSPNARQCIILDQKYETDYYSNISF